MERVDYESLVIQNLVNMHVNDELDLAPWYQRRSVWTRPQKAYLINSLFEGKPVPTVYVRHYLDIEREQSIKEVVDGQQRLRAIVEYAANEFPARHPGHERPVKHSDLTPSERARFKMSKLSIGYLIDTDDADVIEIFGRLNSVSKTLNPQEKRNAQFSGEMKSFCLRQAAKRVRLWKDLGIFTPTEVSRMLEVQFVSDLVLNLLRGLSDFSSPRLNNLYREYDDDFGDRKKIEKRLDALFGAIAALQPSAIRDTAFKRQPLFFSLLMVLDAASKLPATRDLQAALHEVDEVVSDDTPLHKRPAADAEFIEACTSSTQRIKNRRVRHKYLTKRLL